MEKRFLRSLESAKAYVDSKTPEELDAVMSDFDDIDVYYYFDYPDL